MIRVFPGAAARRRPRPFPPEPASGTGPGRNAGVRDRDTIPGAMPEPAPSHPRITLPRERIAEFCRRNGIVRLALFGSVLRDDFRPDSDVDVLVWFRPGSSIGLIGMARLENELADLLGRRVDLRTPEDLSRYFRDRVVRESHVEYAAA